MSNGGFAIPGLNISCPAATWVAMAVVMLVALLSGNEAFAQGSNFRVVYADVRGVEELEAGHFARGIKVLKAELKEADRGYAADVWATLCGAYIIELSLDQAERACDEAVDTGPTFAALNNRGVLRAYRRDFVGAREDFDRARPLQLEAYVQELMARDVRLVAADNYRLISKVLSKRGAQGTEVASRTAEIEDPVGKFRH